MTDKTALDYKNAIQSSGKDIYSPIEIGDADYWIPTQCLEDEAGQGCANPVMLRHFYRYTEVS